MFPAVLFASAIQAAELAPTAPQPPSTTAAPAAVSATARKIAYLTFDDGPSHKITPRILTTLARYEVHGTFFVVGRNAAKHPELMKRIVAEGHAIGNHSWDHAKTIYKTQAGFLDSLKRCDEAIEKSCGVKTTLMRPPYWPTKLFRPAIRKAACQAGYITCGYDIGVADTFARSVDPRTLIANVTEHTNEGKRKRAVILMHDATDKETTADALPDVIDFLKRHGYEFKTLTPEVMQGMTGLE